MVTPKRLNVLVILLKKPEALLERIIKASSGGLANNRILIHLSPLVSGDLLLLMTDGITEPRNSDGVMYEESGRLNEVLSNIPVEMPIESLILSSMMWKPTPRMKSKMMILRWWQSG